MKYMYFIIAQTLLHKLSSFVPSSYVTCKVRKISNRTFKTDFYYRGKPMHDKFCVCIMSNAAFN